MKKTLMGIALLTIGAFSFSASAQNNNTTPCNNQCPIQQCVTPANDNCPAPCNGTPCIKMSQACNNGACYQNLNLSDEQKTRIADLDKGMAESINELKAQAKASDKTEKSNRLNQRRELRTKYLEGMKQILTAEQYTQYLENFYLNNGGIGRDGRPHFAKNAKLRKANFDKAFVQKADKKEFNNKDFKGKKSK